MKRKQPVVRLTVVLPKDIHERLAEIAAEDLGSLNNTIVKACRAATKNEARAR
jgi:hypothetical protein